MKGVEGDSAIKVFCTYLLFHLQDLVLLCPETKDTLYNTSDSPWICFYKNMRFHRITNTPYSSQGKLDTRMGHDMNAKSILPSVITYMAIS